MVQSINNSAVTITPNGVRYSLNAGRRAGKRQVMLSLQRAEKRADGTWMDDPRADARRTVAASDKINPGMDAFEAALAVIAVAVGAAFTPGQDFFVSLNGRLDAAGVLDVSMRAVLDMANPGSPTIIPSLNAFLAAHQALIPTVASAWQTLDASITALNSAEGLV